MTGSPRRPCSQNLIWISNRVEAKGAAGDLGRRIAGDLLRGLTIRQDGRSVAVRASKFGEISEVASLMAKEFSR